MKCLFLINNAPFFAEFFAKLAKEIVKTGDSCIVVWNSKIAEYDKKKLFPSATKFISQVDWNLGNYQKDKKDFGDLSWKEMFSLFDRYKGLDFGYDNSAKIFSQTFQFFERVFKEEKPDVVISEPPAGLFHQVAHYFCEKSNTPYFGLGDSRLNNRIDVYDLEFTNSKCEKAFREIKNSDVSKKEKEFSRNFIEKFVSHKELPSYMALSKIYFSQFGLAKHFVVRIKKFGLLLLRCFFERKHSKGFDYETDFTLKYAIWALWRSEWRKLRILLQKNIYSNSVNGNNFFLYPLHFQPEASTNVYAMYYCDQLNTIKNIAFSLPFPYKLYVKEHPAAVGTKPKEFYRKLKEIPNIVLISPSENVEMLIKDSSGVITLTSTIGMEAALSGKPVYVLGDVLYAYHPLCRKMKNFTDLKDKIRDDLINKPSIEDIDNINSRFITSYLRNTIPGNMTTATVGKDINNYKLIWQSLGALLKKLNYD